MPTVFHTKGLALKKRRSRQPEFEWLTSSRLAKLAGADHLEFDIRSFDPDRFSFPYHFHRAARSYSWLSPVKPPCGRRKAFKRSEPATWFSSNREKRAPISRTITAMDRASIWTSEQLLASMSANIRIQDNWRFSPCWIFVSGPTVDYYRGEENVASKLTEEILGKASDE